MGHWTVGCGVDAQWQFMNETSGEKVLKGVRGWACAHTSSAAHHELIDREAERAHELFVDSDGVSLIPRPRISETPLLLSRMLRSTRSVCRL